MPRPCQDDFGTAQLELSGTGGARDSSLRTSSNFQPHDLLTLYYDSTNWTGIGVRPVVLITMASSLRILVPVKRVIDFAVRRSILS